MFGRQGASGSVPRAEQGRRSRGLFLRGGRRGGAQTKQQVLAVWGSGSLGFRDLQDQGFKPFGIYAVLSGPASGMKNMRQADPLELWGKSPIT